MNSTFEQPKFYLSIQSVFLACLTRNNKNNSSYHKVSAFKNSECFNYLYRGYKGRKPLRPYNITFPIALTETVKNQNKTKKTHK